MVNNSYTDNLNHSQNNITKVTNIILYPYRKTYFMLNNIYRKISAYRTIYFIKPYWGLKELLVYLYSSYLKDEDVDAFLIKFREKMSLNGIVVPTSSGRTAIELALKVLNSKHPNRKYVIIPTYCCKGVFDPIINAKLSPIFVDIDKNLNISSESVKAHINDDVLAIIVPHIAGCRADIESIVKIARDYDVTIIEDCCQSLGLKQSDKYVGTSYDMSVFSFGIGKNLMATAGGMLVSNIYKNELLAETKNLKDEDYYLVKKRLKNIILKYFLHINFNDYQPFLSSYNYNKMHPIDAKLATIQLDKLDEIIEKRQQNSIDILNITKSIQGLTVQECNCHIYTKLTIIYKDEQSLNNLKTCLCNSLIEYEGMYTPLHLRDFARCLDQPNDLLYSENVYKLVLNIPVRPNLSNNDLKRIKNSLSKLKMQYCK